MSRIAWRLGRGVELAKGRLAVRLLDLILGGGILSRLPRRPIAMLERAALAAARDPAFDEAHYLRSNPDVAAAGLRGLDHYLAWGWAEGRDPAPGITAAGYGALARLPEGCRVSLLGHHLARGRRLGLTNRVEPEPGTAIDTLLARLAAIEPKARAGEIAVEVIVPVHSGRAATLSCLAHLLEARNDTPCRITVIDDRGPDKALRRDIARLASRRLVRLIRHPANRGFVAAINTGMAAAEGRDAVWLNADTEMWDGWLDRLRAQAESGPDIATVTPFTNSGTIASYPHFDAAFSGRLELSWRALDRLAARENAGRHVEAPTCVGFCAYIRAGAWTAAGPLDEAAFGAGYGEENDFSCRASAAGWRHLIAGDVFVRHLGGVSFGARRAARIEAAMAEMARRHPGYRAAVRAHIAADPGRALRRRLDLARLAAHAGAGPLLQIGHSRGGGTAQHIEEEAARARAAGQGAVLMTGGTAGRGVRVTARGMGPIPTLDGLEFGDPALGDALRRFAPGRIRLHHLADFGARGAELMGSFLRQLGRPWEAVVHDYMAICPRINLVDRTGRYCGEPGEEGCRRCLVTRRSDFGAPRIGAWRRAHQALLAEATRRIVPDRDVAARLSRHMPGLGFEIVPHERLDLPPQRWSAEPGERTLRIAALGAIGAIKGFDVLLDLAAIARREPGALEIVVIGHTRNDRAARAAGIEVTGRYALGSVQEAIEDAAPDLILLPSLWPETYSYTLSQALMSGRPVAAFDIGALGTRLRDLGRGTPIPYALARKPEALAQALRQASHPVPAEREPATMKKPMVTLSGSAPSEPAAAMPARMSG